MEFTVHKPVVNISKPPRIFNAGRDFEWHVISGFWHTPISFVGISRIKIDSIIPTNPDKIWISLVGKIDEKMNKKIIIKAMEISILAV